MKIKIRNGIFLAVPILLVSGIALALFISNMSIKGSISTNAGTQPANVIFTENIADMNAGTSKTISDIYNNPDGSQNVSFILDDSLVISNSTGCQYQTGKDLTVSIKINGLEQNVNSTTTKQFSLVSGDNIINTTFTLNQNACALSGNYEIIGSLIK